MNIEDFFIKELVFEREKSLELEKQKALLELENKELKKQLKDCAYIFEKIAPSFTCSKNVWLGGHLLIDEDARFAEKLFNKFGIEINKYKNEVEKR